MKQSYHLVSGVVCSSEIQANCRPRNQRLGEAIPSFDKRPLLTTPLQSGHVHDPTPLFLRCASISDPASDQAFHSPWSTPAYPLRRSDNPHSKQHNLRVPLSPWAHPCCHRHSIICMDLVAEKRQRVHQCLSVYKCCSRHLCILLTHLRVL